MKRKKRTERSAVTPPEPDRALVPRPLSGVELDSAAQQGQRWLWHGYLAAGTVTLLTSQWKSGKTTLVSLLLARRRTGGSLAGLAVARGKTAVVSEEAPLHWSQRKQKRAFGGEAYFFCRPFRGKPTPEQWQALLDALLGLHEERGVDLVVIDPLASFLPGRDESHAGLMLEALLPLQQLTTRGLAVLLLHHPRKGETAAGQAARGSGALPGYADIVIEMGWNRSAAESDRRRRLRAFSRHEETPRQLVIELNDDGTDYVALGDFVAEEFTPQWERLRTVLEDAPAKLTRKQVLQRWPDDPTPPTDVSLWRWLDQAVAQGLVRHEGTGRKNNPFRYWLPGREEEVQALTLPPLLDEHQMLREAREKLERRRKQNP